MSDSLTPIQEVVMSYAERVARRPINRNAPKHHRDFYDDAAFAEEEMVERMAEKYGLDPAMLPWNQDDGS